MKNRQFKKIMKRLDSLEQKIDNFFNSPIKVYSALQSELAEERRKEDQREEEKIKRYWESRGYRVKGDRVYMPDGRWFSNEEDDN